MAVVARADILGMAAMRGTVVIRMLVKMVLAEAVLAETPIPVSRLPAVVLEY
jgi:hypothetical protein